ncbi:MAG: MBOAT family O-acyltransferase [Bacillota bacterium]|nr:MBOAT family O-acyltransferase [Bacillota bacterium]
MIFSGLTFLFYFLPLTLLLYFSAPNLKLKNLVLLVSSMIFYAWGEPIYIILMVVSSLNDYLFSNLIQNYRDRHPRVEKSESAPVGAHSPVRRSSAFRPRPDRLYFLLSVIINLALLGVFKYTDFLIGTLNSLTGLQIDPLGLPLPIGISFYTFQTMSYSIDVYLGRIRAQKNFLTLATYVCLFPQLIAGPIVRYKTIEEELTNRRSTLTDVADGMRRFIIGLAKKVLIANTMGVIVDRIFVPGGIPTHAPVLWLAAVAYTFQIYFDFSGYSDMAIGLGRVFGFHFLENFRYPYMSASMTDFWRRWHISLGTWFRDYVYIPLGGNRRHQILNIAVVWFLTGMWHGAYLNYILWGLFHGFFLTAEKLLNGRIKLPYILKRVLTMFLVVVGFTIFRLENMETLAEVLGNMFRFTSLTSRAFILEYNNILYALPMLLVACIASVSWRELPYLRKRKNPPHSLLRYGGMFGSLFRDSLLLILFGLSVVSIVGSGFNPFIYFRF